MTPEERKLLQDTYELAQDTNTMVRRMRNATRWTSVLRAVYWILILAISFGAYVYAKPYLNNLTQIYSGLDLNVNQVNAIRDNLSNMGK